MSEIDGFLPSLQRQTHNLATRASELEHRA
jgi:hypothetical protein